MKSIMKNTYGLVLLWIFNYFIQYECLESPGSCENVVCSNGGTCINVNKGHICDCPTHFSGNLCQIGDVQCFPNPCMNQGRCKANGNTFHCTCSNLFTGNRCQKELKSCSSPKHRCRNGGTCLAGSRGHRCVCPLTYVGEFCQNDDHCYKDRCKNGAVCSTSNNSFTCTCKPGYIGVTCDNELDECLSQPCLHLAKCLDKVDGFQCLCQPGTKGTLCQHSIKAISANCKVSLVTPDSMKLEAGDPLPKSFCRATFPIISMREPYTFTVKLSNNAPGLLGASFGVMFNIRNDLLREYDYIKIMNSKVYIGYSISNFMIDTSSQYINPPVGNNDYLIKITTGYKISLQINGVAIAVSGFSFYPEIRKIAVFIEKPANFKLQASNLIVSESVIASSDTLDPTKYTQTGCSVPRGVGGGSSLVSQVADSTNLTRGVLDARGGVGGGVVGGPSSQPTTACIVLMDILTLHKVPSLRSVWAYKYRVRFKAIYGQTDTRGIYRYGVLYNAQDEHNFDFALFEYEKEKDCVKLGYMLGGYIFYSDVVVDVDCKQMQPVNDVYVEKAEITVQSYKKTKLKINDISIDDITPYFDINPKVGVFALNGYRNLILFSNESVTKLYINVKDYYEIGNCGSTFSYKNNSTYVLNVKQDKNTKALCYVYRSLIPEKAYFYNIKLSLKSDHSNSENVYEQLGLSYNICNGSFYEFIMFRIKDSTNCYELGMVYNGEVAAGSKFGHCPGGPISPGDWFNITAKITDENIDIYLGNRFIVTTTFNMKLCGLHAIVVNRTHDSSVLFKEFHVHAGKLNKVNEYFSHSCERSPHLYINTLGNIKMESKLLRTTQMFCRSLAPPASVYRVPVDAYDVKASLSIASADFDDSTDVAGGGVIYNVKQSKRGEITDFDFVYVNINGDQKCFNYGFNEYGSISIADMKHRLCTRNFVLPSQKEWFTLTVKVRAYTAEILLNNKTVWFVNNHFMPSPRAGTMINFGSKTFLNFKPIVVEPSSLKFAKDYQSTNCRYNGVIEMFSTIEVSAYTDIGVMCRIISNHPFVKGQGYQIKAQLFVRSTKEIRNKANWMNKKEKPMVLFNVMDNTHFDFIQFSIDDSQCYRWGYMDGNQTIVYLQWNTCLPAKFHLQQWTRIKIIVHGGISARLVFGRQAVGAVSYAPRFNGLSRIGFAALTSADTLVKVKHLKVYKSRVTYAQNYVPVNCGEIEGFVLNNLDKTYSIWANGGRYPGDGICRAIHSVEVNGPNYEFKIKMYNKYGGFHGGSEFGNFGIIYNVIDKDNFDFIYITVRPHIIDKPTTCYQTGAMIQGNLDWSLSYTGFCPEILTMRPRTWFEICIRVSVYGDATFSVNDVDVLTPSPRHQRYGRVGVMVVNGWSNTVLFKWPSLKATDKDKCAQIQPCNNGICVDTKYGYKCICMAQFMGRHCTLVKLSCLLNNICAHGQCISSTYKSTHPRVHCVCPHNFSGENCTTKVDACHSQPCRHGGRCVVTVSKMSYQCVCLGTDSVGTHCETAIDQCSSSPCLHSAKCIDMIYAFKCRCPPGYGGSACEVSVDPCSAMPCLNGGTCFHAKGKLYACKCTRGVIGDNCHIYVNRCLKHPCFNGGECVSRVNSFHCRCLPGFWGPRCRRGFNNLCSSSPCLNGASCVDEITWYRCQCLSDYLGTNCEISRVSCLSYPCSNNATCHNMISGYYCKCSQAYTGVTCGSMVAECFSQPCQHGSTCHSLNEGYRCICDKGFVGHHCEIRTGPCLDSVCENGGHCIASTKDRLRGYECICPVSYAGYNCELDAVDCSYSPCVKGRCIQSYTGYSRCLCPLGYLGITCHQFDTNACLIGKCAPKGECVIAGTKAKTRVNIGDYIAKAAVLECSCDEGYTGGLCELEHDYCLSRPCGVHGHCENMARGINIQGIQGIKGIQGIRAGRGFFMCICKQGYTGAYCDSRVTSSNNNNICFNNRPCLNGATCEVIKNGGSFCRCTLLYMGNNCEMNIFYPSLWNVNIQFIFFVMVILFAVMWLLNAFINYNNEYMNRRLGYSIIDPTKFDKNEDYIYSDSLMHEEKALNQALRIMPKEALTEKGDFSYQRSKQDKIYDKR